MKLNSAPLNKAEMSGVGAVSDFKIATSAKAFQILSSSLYQNKIRAIVRELSCNAYDSHVMAGNQDKPFDLHLPTNLEPHFSVRDYGIGLNDDEVRQIYTTYFESTKTDSNDVVGALGLGSKSPFAYTDNFAVTAYKDGMKRVYSAFINDEGVPAIALMLEIPSDEPNGVEVKFPVNNAGDMHTFVREATTVFSFFDVNPNQTGAKFNIVLPKYIGKEIIPGVRETEGKSESYAVMGFIQYPISTSIEGLIKYKDILNYCGLEFKFGIGELDIQPSREGLSYNKQTISSIVKKIEELISALYDKFKKETDAIACDWEKSVHLYNRRSTHLWKECVSRYAKDTKFKLYDDGRYSRTFYIDLDVDQLAKLNIDIKEYRGTGYSCTEYKPRKDNTTGKYTYRVTVSQNSLFVANDTNIGAVERTKYHIRNTLSFMHREVYLFTPLDKKKPMEIDKVWEMLYNPPMAQRFKVSDLMMKPKKVVTKSSLNTPILCLSGSGSHERDYKWDEAAELKDYPDNKTYIYVQLKGWEMVSNYHTSPKMAIASYYRAFGITFPLYGIRTKNIDAIKAKKNWIEFDKFMMDVLKTPSQEIINKITFERYHIYSKFVSGFKPYLSEFSVNSPFRKVMEETIKVASLNKHAGSFDKIHVGRLCLKYHNDSTLFEKALAQHTQAPIDIFDKYPLLDMYSSYTSATKQVAYNQYIKLIDQQNGVI